MPGGPIDPENILNAINGGATWSSNHLVIASVSKWPVVVSTRWALTSSAAALIDHDTFTALQGATCVAGIITAGGVRYTLVPVTVAGSVWATLQAL
jgi:hypothetical protein